MAQQDDVDTIDRTGQLTVNDGISRLLSLDEASTPDNSADSADDVDPGDGDAADSDDDPKTPPALDEDGTTDEAEEDAADAASEEDDQEDAEETFRVKAGGEWVEVTLDELQRGYARTADYTRDKNALKAEKDAFQGEIADTRTLRTQFREKLGQLEDALKALQPDEASLKALRESDPDRFAEVHAEFERRKDAIAKVAAERERQETAEQQDVLQEAEVFLADQKARLTQRIPEAGDEEEAKGWWKDLVAYADETLGLDPGLTHQLAHAGMVEAIDKARRYDALQASKETVTTKRRRTRAAKPGARKAPDRKKPAEEARARVQQTGTKRDAIAALLAMREKG